MQLLSRPWRKRQVSEKAPKANPPKDLRSYDQENLSHEALGFLSRNGLRHLAPPMPSEWNECKYDSFQARFGTSYFAPLVKRAKHSFGLVGVMYYDGGDSFSPPPSYEIHLVKVTHKGLKRVSPQTLSGKVKAASKK